MPLTGDYREGVRARAAHDPAFRTGLVREAIGVVAEGDLPTARILLREAIHLTMGFAELSKTIGVGEKSLMRMFGPEGNPTATNLLATIKALRSHVGLDAPAKKARKRL